MRACDEDRGCPAPDNELDKEGLGVDDELWRLEGVSPAMACSTVGSGARTRIVRD